MSQVCKVAPIPGETKVWQYITLMKKIFLIDCPGVVYHRTGDTDTQAVLKGVVRVENLVGSMAILCPSQVPLLCTVQFFISACEGSDPSSLTYTESHCSFPCPTAQFAFHIRAHIYLERKLRVLPYLWVEVVSVVAPIIQANQEACPYSKFQE